MPRIGPGERQQLAIAVIATASTDASLRIWLETFEATHARFLDAQSNVEAKADALRQARLELRSRNAELDHAMNKVIVARILAGKPRMRALRGLNTAAPSQLERRAYGAKIKELQALANGILRGPATPQANQAAVELLATADRMAQALQHFAAAKHDWQLAIHTRELIGSEWSRALQSLRHAAAALGKQQLAKHIPARPPRRRRRRSTRARQTTD